jgi:hypothetical protein
MARLALALIAILVLALSAGLRHTQLPSPSSPQVSSFQALKPQQALSSEFDVASAPQQGQMPALSAGHDAPEPALIAYLALVLIGSLIAVGAVRHSERSGG